MSPCVLSICCLGVGIVFLSVVSPPSVLDFLESLVSLGYVASGLSSCLSPGGDMIPNEGIIVRPIG